MASDNVNIEDSEDLMTALKNKVDKVTCVWQPAIIEYIAA
jgi:hypothetical protein